MDMDGYYGWVRIWCSCYCLFHHHTVRRTLCKDSPEISVRRKHVPERRVWNIQGLHKSQSAIRHFSPFAVSGLGSVRIPTKNLTQHQQTPINFTASSPPLLHQRCPSILSPPLLPIPRSSSLTHNLLLSLSLLSFLRYVCLLTHQAVYCCVPMILPNSIKSVGV